MFRSLRNRLLLTYGTLIGIIFVAIGASLLFYLAVSQRGRIEPQVAQLIENNKVIINALMAYRDTQPEAGESPLDIESLSDELDDIAQDLNNRILLVRRGRPGGGNNGSGPGNGNGRQTIILYDSLGILTGEPLPEFEPVSSSLYRNIDLPGSSSAVIQFNDLATNPEWLAYSRPIRRDSTIGVPGVEIINAIPTPTPLTAFQNTFLLPLTISGIGALFVAVIFAFGISRWIARPLQKVSQAAEEMAEGTYNHQLEVRGPSEIQSLVESFNRMSQEVQASQLAQKDFIANVSHDLKTPLTSIQGWSQALLDGAVQPKDLDKAANVIHTESERMNRMVQQLLAVAKLEGGQIEFEPTPVDLTAVAENVHRSLQFQAEEKAIALNIHLAAEAIDTPVVWGDRDQLTQLLTNLVQNGLNHTSAGGEVRIELNQDQRHQLVLGVLDTGVGIDEADQARIFERFYQTDKARTGHTRGTGLGLSIVKTIADQHSAQLGLQSVLGQGSRFTVTFPQARPHSNGQPSR